MVGYHYTSSKNWEIIKKEGLKPKIVENMQVYTNIQSATGRRPSTLFGIWIWEKMQDRVSHAGNILRAVAVHNDPVIVLLKVTFKDEDILRIMGRRLSLTHDGDIENWVYHKDETAYILANEIPIEQIKKIGEWNIVERLKYE